MVVAMLGLRADKVRDDVSCGLGTMECLVVSTKQVGTKGLFKPLKH